MSLSSQATSGVQTLHQFVSATCQQGFARNGPQAASCCCNINMCHNPPFKKGTGPIRACHLLLIASSGSAATAAQQLGSCVCYCGPRLALPPVASQSLCCALWRSPWQQHRTYDLGRTCEDLHNQHRNRRCCHLVQHLHQTAVTATATACATQRGSAPTGAAWLTSAVTSRDH